MIPKAVLNSINVSAMTRRYDFDSIRRQRFGIQQYAESNTIQYDSIQCPLIDVTNAGVKSGKDVMFSYGTGELPK